MKILLAVLLVLGMVPVLAADTEEQAVEGTKKEATAETAKKTEAVKPAKESEIVAVTEDECIAVEPGVNTIEDLFSAKDLQLGPKPAADTPADPIVWRQP